MDATPRELSYSQAIQEAMAIAMEADERVFLMGEDIGVYGGAFQVTGDLVERFGADRVMDTPISELGGAGVAVGAAMTGSRPIFEFQFSDFATLAMEQIVNQAAKMRFMLGGEVSVPVVMRFPAGSGTGAAAQHSQSLEAWLGHVPGLKVIQPATPYDAKGMLLAAVADPDPVMIFEHKLLYKLKGPVPEGHYTVPIGKAEIRREGKDLTVVATSIMVHKSLEAAEALASEGIDIEVVDLRTIRPMDKATIIASVKKTSRLLCVYEAVKTLGIGAEVSATIAESEAFDYLDAPIVRLGGAETPIPYNPELEKATVPQVPDIIAAARDLVRGETLMPVEVILPKVDMDMATGQISRWFIAEGATVKQGDVLFEIETDKAAMEIDLPASGTVRDIVGKEGVDIAVGSPVAWIYAEGEAYQDKAPISPPVGEMSAKPTEAGAVQQTSLPVSPPSGPEPIEVPASGGIRATPLARRIARENGIDISSIAGSGPHGRVVQADVQAAIAGGAKAAPAAKAAPGATPAPAPVAKPMSDDAVLKLFEEGSYELIPHDNMRKTIARRLVEAKSTIPHFYLTLDCDIDALLKLRGEINAAAPVQKTDKGEVPAYKISVNDMVIKAMAMALSDVPAANVSWTESAMVKHSRVDVGVAVSIPGGLITPIIRHADTKTLSAIANEMKDLAARARTKKLKPEEYQGGTTAVSNLGMFGIKDFAAVINPPHATILAVGAGEERAVVKKGQIVAATMMSVTLSTDHRAVDGALGAELLAAFKRRIENPLGMLV